MIAALGLIGVGVAIEFGVALANAQQVFTDQLGAIGWIAYWGGWGLIAAGGIWAARIGTQALAFASRRPDRTVLHELASEAWAALTNNRDLSPSSPNADARSARLGRWAHLWAIKVERALAPDDAALAAIRHDVNTQQMHYVMTPAFILWTRLRSLDSYLPPSVRVEMDLQDRWDTEGGQPATPPAEDFIGSPDQPLYARMVAWAASANEDRRQRARVRAWHSLRETLKREPSPVELAAYASVLYQRSDTALSVTDGELAAFARSQSAINAAVSSQGQT